MMWSEEGPKRSTSPSIKQVFERVRAIIERWAHLDEKGTDSGIFVSEKRPTASLYWKAVREVVKISEAKALLPKGSIFKGYNTGRGIIGASASVAWVPKDHTFEVLVYRKKERWGTPRDVKVEDVKSLDERFPSTFNNYDLTNKHATIVPATPCPILIGIRGDDPAVLPDAMMSIRTEDKDRYVVFETNQGTDDHILSRKRISRYQSGILRGEVRTVPYVITGGHVLFDLKVLPKGSTYTCSAYEPTKEFRRVVRALVIGDVISVWGSRTSSNPNTINLEKLKIEKLSVVMTKVGNPRCPSCGKNMKSIGKGQGYRCRRCGIKDKDAGVKANIIEDKRPLYLGYYEVPICARRHLFKPLKRMKVPKNEFESFSAKSI
jgi:tRNA(Ile2)-agmatinylcytidine synthase